MLLDSNILIYAANQSAPEIESLVVSAENAVASVTQIEVYGFTGLKPEEQAALDVLFRRLTVHPLDAAVVNRAIALRQESIWDWPTPSSPPPPWCMVCDW